MGANHQSDKELFNSQMRPGAGMGAMRKDSRDYPDPSSSQNSVRMRSNSDLLDDSLP